MEKVVILLRGCPGSGKSSLADILPGYTCTADDYHMVDGVYVWKGENQGKAHLACQEKCRKLMHMGSTPIKVANTLTTVKEMKPYYDMAQEFGYRVYSIICENRHNGVNVHGVPEETLIKMRERFNISL
jgi:predicted kinase